MKFVKSLAARNIAQAHCMVVIAIKISGLNHFIHYRISESWGRVIKFSLTLWVNPHYVNRIATALRFHSLDNLDSILGVHFSH